MFIHSIAPLFQKQLLSAFGVGVWVLGARNAWMNLGNTLELETQKRGWIKGT